MHNGFSTDAVTDKGAEKLGVEVMGRKGIVGRGVLLDIAARRAVLSRSAALSCPRILKRPKPRRA